ncbi:MAG: MFS transporter [Phycisphaerae bacterium]
MNRRSDNGANLDVHDLSGASQRGPLVSTRLSLMMFLQYAAWGVWLPYIANYLGAPIKAGGLGFSSGQIGWILGLAGSIGAVSSPFLAGQIADRFINAERYLGMLLICGGVLNYSLYYIHDYATFLLVSVLYSVMYMPTLALTNSLAFAHVSDSEKQFPRIRVWGTIGWIVASNAFPLLWLQTKLHPIALPPFFEGQDLPNAKALLGDCLRASGIIAVLYGLYALTCLPATPPKRNAENPLAFMQAFKLLTRPGFLVLTLAALPISMIHQVYFFRTSQFLESIGFSLKYVGPVMSIGQFSEIFFLAILGLLLTRLGYRWTLVLGALAYASRFAVFAIGTPETREWVAVANTLHGLCYGCFFASAYLYVEKVAPPDIRHSAQTVFGIIMIGLGPILAGFYNDKLLGTFTVSGGGPDYARIWWTQAGVALVAMLFVAVAFREDKLEMQNSK